MKIKVQKIKYLEVWERREVEFSKLIPDIIIMESYRNNLPDSLHTMPVQL